MKKTEWWVTLCLARRTAGLNNGELDKKLDEELSGE